MNIAKINQVLAFIKWVQDNTKYSANFEISHHSYSHRKEIKVEYRLWISDSILNQSSCDINTILGNLEHIKTICIKRMIIDNSEKLKEVAA